MDDSLMTGGICGCCCLLLFVFFIFGGGSSDNGGSSSDIVVNNLSDYEPLTILNMSNVSFVPSGVNFVYYDHNSSVFEGCYGLNYTVLSDGDGNGFMLDHATSDIFGDRTNYTFSFPGGVGVVFDNNTETEIYNRTGLYYVHELRDDMNNSIKSLGNFTLYDSSHEPQVIPDGWLFVYRDHNSSVYEGDEGLSEAITFNRSAAREELHFVHDEDIIGLAYESDRSFDYKYGLSGVRVYDLGNSEHPVYTVEGYGLCYPNGTRIDTFDIEDYDLTRNQKDFLTDYYGRIDDVRHKQEVDAIYDAEDEAMSDYILYQDSSRRNHRTSYYYGTNGVGAIYTP